MILWSTTIIIIKLYSIYDRYARILMFNIPLQLLLSISGSERPHLTDLSVKDATHFQNPTRR